MLGLIVAIIIGFWFYKTAQRVGRGPWKWAAIGAFSFWIPEILLTLLLLRLASPMDPSNVIAMMTFVFVTSFGVALAIAYSIRSAYLTAERLNDLNQADAALQRAAIIMGLDHRPDQLADVAATLDEFVAVHRSSIEGAPELDVLDTGSIINMTILVKDASDGARLNSDLKHRLIRHGISWE